MTIQALHTIEPKVSKKESNNILFGVMTFLALFLPVVLHSALGIAFSPVLSNSMKPGMGAGDLLITKEVPASTLKVGDIVILRNGVSYDLFSHRIASIKLVGQEMQIVTKGDANPVADAGIAKVNPRAMIPKGITRAPWLGRPIVYFSNHKANLIGGFLLIVGLAFGLLRFLARRSLKAEARKIDELQMDEPFQLEQPITNYIPASAEVANFEALLAEKQAEKKAKKKPSKKAKKKAKSGLQKNEKKDQSESKKDKKNAKKKKKSKK
jgi:signal peptidase